MRKKYGCVLVFTSILSLSSLAVAQQPLRWEPTLESAKRRAAQTDRLVLIHFRADWCGACRTMEREVLDQPAVVAALQTYYVPVKINADYFPATRKQYGVIGLPTDVIVTPQGQEIEKIRGPIDAASYVARLNSVAMAVRGQNAERYAQVPGGPAGRQFAAAPNGPPQNGPPQNSPPQNSPPQNDPNDRYADYFNRQQQGPATPPENHQHNSALMQNGMPRQPAAPPQDAWYGQPVEPPRYAQSPPPFAPPQQTPPGPPISAEPPGQSLLAGPGFQPPAVQPPPIQSQPTEPADVNPPLGLDGYCPVELTENVIWTLGNRLWGALHRGRTYLFSGEEQQRRFMADPDRYAPVLSGDDVVIALDENRQVAGHRKHGVFFGGKIYLFSNEASLAKFGQDPNHYASRALQVATAQASRHLGQGLR